MQNSIVDIIKKLKQNRQNKIDLIPSNSLINTNIHKLIRSNTFLLNNCYIEGYPTQRFYEGSQEFDKIELYGQAYLQQIYKYTYINIQPLSGSIANQAIYHAILKSGDKILALDIYSGGHITHTSINITNDKFKFVHYNVTEEYQLCYKQIYQLAIKHKPKLIITGYSVGTYDIDHKQMKEIADKIKAIYLADLSHTMGLIAARIMNSPYPYADIVMSTTHKTMCGVKGAIIMCNDPVISKKLNTTLFPKIQGGANCTQIVINTLTFKHMLSTEFKEHMKKVVANTNTLTKYLNQEGVHTITKTSKNHMNMIDLSGQKIDVKNLAKILDQAHIITNANATIKDKSFAIPSGIRFGTNIITYRKINTEQIYVIAKTIKQIIEDIKTNKITNTIHKHKQNMMQITSNLCDIE